MCRSAAQRHKLLLYDQGAPPAPDGRTARAVGGRSPPNKKGFITKWLSQKWSWSGPIALVLLALFAGGFFSGSIGASLAESAASLTRDVTRITSSGANLTIALSDLAISVSRSSTEVVGEFWSGVDLNDVKANITGSKWIMHKALAENGKFFQSEMGAWLGPKDLLHQQQILLACRGVAKALPEVRKNEIYINFNNTYSEFALHVTMLPNGYVGVNYLLVQVSFSPEWANPMWSMFHWSPSSELEKVKARLHNAIRDVPSTSWVELNQTPQALNELVKIQPSWVLEAQYYAMHWWHSTNAE